MTAATATEDPVRPSFVRRVRENRLTYYLLRYKRQYILGLTMLVVAAFVTMLPPLVLRLAIDGIVDDTTSVRRLAALGAVILVMAILESVARLIGRWYVSGTSRRIEYGLRNDLAAQLMRLDQQFFVRARTGDLMARATNDLQWVRDLLGPTLNDIWRTAVMLVVGVAFLLSIDVRLTLIALAYMPFLAALVIVVEGGMERKFRDVQDQFGVVTNRVQENISGIRAIKAYAQENAEIAAFERDNERLMRTSLGYFFYAAGFLPTMIFATGAGTALILWFGGREVVGGGLTLGQFVQFSAYLGLLTTQLSTVGWIVAAWQAGTASMARISEVLREQPRVVSPPQPRTHELVRGEIEFRDVTFAYPDVTVSTALDAIGEAASEGAGREVLRELNLHIPAGTRLAIAGETGSGKTTLVHLLARMSDPQRGQVLVDGVDVRELPLAELREAIAVVPQEAMLFSESLRDNVSFARLDASESEVDRAVLTSQLSIDLPQLSDGLETLIGERGLSLSGGQKQRATLARALLKDAPVLVLDDALSHVDTHTEEEILRRLRDVMAQRTTIVVAHRTTTLQSAERVVVLAEGRVVEDGSHAELLAAGGTYARLYRSQSLREQLEHAAGDDDGAAS